MTTTLIERSQRHEEPTTTNEPTSRSEAVREAFEQLTPTPSAPERAAPEVLRHVSHGFGGPY